MNNSILNTDGNSQSYGLLELSAKVEYALLALLELAINHGKKVTLTINDIAAKQPIPERYLEQILTQLRRAGIVQSQRGSKGGFLLVREPWEISLLEIVSLIEGERNEKRNANVFDNRENPSVGNLGEGQHSFSRGARSLHLAGLV